MGKLIWYYWNLWKALWRLVIAIKNPPIIPKRLDQLVGAFCGLDFRITISRWARHNSGKLYTRPIFWITAPFDYQHVLEIDDTRPYFDSPGLPWAILGNTILILIMVLFQNVLHP